MITIPVRAATAAILHNGSTEVKYIWRKNTSLAGWRRKTERLEKK
jgi:hypothetical protein